MEFKEISTSSLALKTLLPFCMNSLGDNKFSLLTKNSTQVIKIQYKSTVDTNSINLLMSNCKCSKSQPTKNLQINLKAVFNAASTEEKHKICLAPVFMTEMAPNSSTLIQNSWSPLNFYEDERLLASLNIYGQVEVSNSIKQPISPENEEWKSLINISKILLKYLDVQNDEQIRKFQKLQERVDDLVITSISWKDSIEHETAFLACAAKSGRLFIVGIKTIIDPTNIESQTYEFNTNPQVSCMKWFTDPTTMKSFILAGSHDGKVILYKTEISSGKIDSFDFKTVLWSDDDSISVSCIHVNFCDDKNNILVIIVKGSHVVLALLNSDGDLLQMDAYYVGNLFIVSLNELCKFNYVIATMAGYIIELKVKIDGDKFNYETEQVKCNIDFIKYTLYGVAASDNKCLWIFATYPDMQFDHLSLRNPLNLIVCSLSSAEPLKILLENSTYRLTNCKDAAELYRLEKFKCFEENDVITDGVSITQKYIYSLKLRIIVLGANAGYYRRRSEKLYLNKLQDIENIIQIIDGINAYLNLKQINEYENKSDVQLRAARNLRVFIKMYLKRDTFYEYKKIQNLLKSEFEQLYQETGYLTEIHPETCSYCGEEIQTNELNCSNNHPILRCCFTYLQLTFMTSKWCFDCKRGVLPIEDLKQVINTIEQICPLCDGPFMKYNGTT